MRLRRIFLICAAAALAFGADSPFAGKWKLNPSKSQLAGQTTTIEKLPSGEMMITESGQSYKFRLDGKEYPAPFGETAAWKQIDDHTWEATYKNPGMQTTVTTRLSADGKTLTEVSKGKKPNGESTETTATSQRVSGGPGLVGKWKSTEVKAASQMWEIAAKGEDGLIIKIVDYNATCDLKFDGKDYAPTGPTVPKNFTLAIKKTGARSFDMTEKMDGKAAFNDAYTVSADGKTLTLVSAPAGSTEKTTYVYDRQ